MKKRLLALLLLLAVGATASAEMTQHLHCPWTIPDEMYIEYIDMDDYHDVRYLQKQLCLDCGSEDYVAEHWFMEGHEFYLADEFHHEDKHYFFYTCAMCGHETMRTLYCPGPPCNIVNGAWSCALVEPNGEGRYIKPGKVDVFQETMQPPAEAEPQSFPIYTAPPVTVE